MASMPRQPPVVVWLSEPRRVLPGNAEALPVDVVGDARSRGAKDHAVFWRRLEEAVVVGVLVVGLDDVVVDVADRELSDLDPWEPHGLEFEVGHCPGRVLGQGLVDPNADFLPGAKVPSTRCSFKSLSAMVFFMALFFLLFHVFYRLKRLKSVLSTFEKDGPIIFNGTTISVKFSFCQYAEGQGQPL